MWRCSTRCTKAVAPAGRISPRGRQLLTRPRPERGCEWCADHMDARVCKARSRSRQVLFATGRMGMTPSARHASLSGASGSQAVFTPGLRRLDPHSGGPHDDEGQSCPR